MHVAVQRQNQQIFGGSTPGGLIRPSPGGWGRSSGGCVPPRLYFRGLPRPGPRGYFALGGKVTKTPPGTPRPPLLSNRSPSGFDSALPLNQKILRASDLWRAAYPASPDGLLKGQMNLFVSLDQKRLSSRGLTSEVDSPPDRLRRAVGKKEIQWLRSAPLQASNWTKAGSGVSPAAFWSLFRRGKSDPGFGAG